VRHLLLVMQGGRRVLPWWLRLRVAAQVSAAVAYLHGLPGSAGGPLVHRDIKPANWFLDGRLNAKLGDMGLALPLSEAEAASRRRGGAADREAAMVGTWQYMPPEYRCELGAVWLGFASVGCAVLGDVSLTLQVSGIRLKQCLG
jgi:serine/threonine protein kinase